MQELDSVRKVGHNRKWYGSVDIINFFTVILTPHVITLLSGFMVLQQEEARLINNNKINYVIFHHYRVKK